MAWSFKGILPIVLFPSYVFSLLFHLLLFVSCTEMSMELDFFGFLSCLKDTVLLKSESLIHSWRETFQSFCTLSLFLLQFLFCLRICYCFISHLFCFLHFLLFFNLCFILDIFSSPTSLSILLSSVHIVIRNIFPEVFTRDHF